MFSYKRKSFLKSDASVLGNESGRLFLKKPWQ